MVRRHVVLIVVVAAVAGCGIDPPPDGGSASPSTPGSATTAPAAGDPNDPTEGAPEAAPLVTATAEEAGIRLDVSAPERVGGNVVMLDVTVDGVELVPPDGDTSGTTGHLHVFVDQPPVAPGEVIPGNTLGIIHSATSPIEVSGLDAGPHELTVVLGDGAHQRIGELEATVTVETQGPWLRAEYTQATAGEPIELTISHELPLAPAAEGTGDTAHFHVIVDGDVPPAGEPIATDDPSIIHTAETTIELPPLEAGRHTILVVAGGDDHVPLDPPVRHRIDVTL